MPKGIPYLVEVDMGKTISAISTAIGESGIGIVRMSGERAIEIGNEIFRSVSSEKIEKKDNRIMKYGHIVDKDKIIDEVLICFMFAPNTYTKEDMVEIHTHGGSISVKKVFDLTLKKGCDPAERGEFTKRAFLNGRIDLSQAEAVMDLVSAKGEKGYYASLNQLEGKLTKKVKQIREILLEVLAYIEVSINFSEDGQELLSNDEILAKLALAVKELKKLKDTVNKGKILREGISVSILGKPNVGKSSLLNYLLDENRAIVTDIPGTTRDVIQECINLNGLVLKINDTAGIRNASDEVEKIGVMKSLEIAEKSDLILAMFDSSKELDEEDLKILSIVKDKKIIVILNKTDLKQKTTKNLLKSHLNAPIIEISVKESKGIDKLENLIERMFYEGDISYTDDVIITNIRHENIIEKSLSLLENAMKDIENQIPIDCFEVDIKQSWQIMGEITGELIEDEIIDKIFRDFCIGK